MAHFLFGESTGPRLPGQLSLGAAVQWFALRHAQNGGAHRYDFHGLTASEAPHTHPTSPHSYDGVSAFKKQFQGDHLLFVHPTFEIEVS